MQMPITVPPGYQFQLKLGQGGYSQVYACRNIATGEDVAVKHLRCKDRGLPCLMEANIMMTLSHPHLVSAKKVVVDGDSLYIIQTRADCDVESLLRHGQIPDLRRVRVWIFSLVQAIASLHQQKIVHGDVKAPNVLLFSDGTIRLGDFSLAHKMFTPTMSYRACTSTHRPMEIWLGEMWDLSIDIWALGCTIFEMVYGTNLFPYQQWEKEIQLDKERLQERFIACLDDYSHRGPGGKQAIPYTYPKPRCNFVPFRLPTRYHHPDYAPLNRLIMSMLRFNPTERPSITEILQDPYFTGLPVFEYATLSASAETMSPARQNRYIQTLSGLRACRDLITTTLSLLSKIQHLKFRYPNHDEDDVRFVGAYCLAHKIVHRRLPSEDDGRYSNYTDETLHRIEIRICDHLEYRLLD